MNYTDLLKAMNVSEESSTNVPIIVETKIEIEKLEDTNNLNINYNLDMFMSNLIMHNNLIYIKYLNSQNYAEHGALNDLYTKSHSIITTLVQLLQTENLLCLKLIENPCTLNSLDCVKYFLECIKKNRHLLNMSFLQTFIDTLEEQCSMCIYKLTFLK